jgi:DNA-binding response OmpR family regulator
MQMRVLIADDDPVYRELVGNLLRQWGCEVVEACDGLEAWKILSGPDAPPMAVLDWVMPGLDGFEICLMLRQDASHSDVYVLLLTGSKLRDDIIKVIVAGADDYLLKPFEPMDLKMRIRNATRILNLQSELKAIRKPAPKPASLAS